MGVRVKLSVGAKSIALLVIEEPNQLVGKELVEGKALQGIDRKSFEAFLKKSRNAAGLTIWGYNACRFLRPRKRSRLRTNP